MITQLVWFASGTCGPGCDCRRNCICGEEASSEKTGEKNDCFGTGARRAGRIILAKAGIIFLIHKLRELRIIND